ncbi:MAG: ABC transporter permease [Gammaproteobacteria bacterium]|nr:ABC transporter permease [Gammaproteobacteria bacterium]MDE0279476.1 ABC transporter permease [Gammaproteobacteria bacterium]MDE0715033.1 ABC transporter permease [Gammaproteobacteria bacterium]MXX17454.1 ABC transporter permease [Gammaproteobacteria bacterium]MXY63991.1 ABC transporter permease [Gammaproteobacteria bacterium]
MTSATATDANPAGTGEVMTADGVPLRISLARARRRSRNRALLLVAPLFLFVLITFFIPILSMLFRSVENQIVGETLPHTVEALQQWDESGGDLPPEEVYAALVEDLRIANETKTAGKVGRRMNYEKSGFASLFRTTARRIKRIEAPYKETLIKAKKDWGELETWQVLKRESDAYTLSYYLAAVDFSYTPTGEVLKLPDDRSLYVGLFWRTIWMSLLITVLCLILAYPISYLLSTLPVKTSNLLMILVLLPFWTSLLVRTSAWIALLQKEGVINDLLVWVGLIGDEHRLTMIHNATGTIVAMTHVLLPFMVLPLYSVMKTIPPSYMRAARSLGATPFMAFVRVYMPNTVPGIGAGALLVFIISIGYYITPALVGGQSGTLISNFIAYHLSISLNWGLAAALGTILLVLVLALYILYDKIVGIDNMKMG